MDDGLRAKMIIWITNRQRRVEEEEEEVSEVSL